MAPISGPADAVSEVEWREIARDASEVRAFRRRLRDSLIAAGAAEDAVRDAELIFSEMLSNSIRYASGDVEVFLEWQGRNPVIHVIDEGPAFDPAPAVRDAGWESGRGLFIISTLAKAFAVERLAIGKNHAKAVLACRR